jgi:hypothetical protein
MFAKETRMNLFFEAGLRKTNLSLHQEQHFREGLPNVVAGNDTQSSNLNA